MVSIWCVNRVTESDLLFVRRRGNRKDEIFQCSPILDYSTSYTSSNRKINSYYNRRVSMPVLASVSIAKTDCNELRQNESDHRIVDLRFFSSKVPLLLPKDLFPVHLRPGPRIGHRRVLTTVKIYPIFVCDGTTRLSKVDGIRLRNLDTFAVSTESIHYPPWLPSEFCKHWDL